MADLSKLYKEVILYHNNNPVNYEKQEDADQLIEAYNPLVRFYSQDDTPTSLTDRFTERVLGMPLGCAQCHDHKFYPELLQKDYWGLAGFFNSTGIENLLASKISVVWEHRLSDLSKIL